MSMANADNPVDTGLLSEITGDDEALGREMLGDFIELKSVEVRKLVEMLEQGELREVAALAHRLKGAAQTVAAQPLAQVCQIIEASGGKGERTVVAGSRRRLEAEFARLKDYVER